MNDDPALAARFPDTVGGDHFEVQTYCASVFEEGGLNTAPELLDEIGVELADVTIARSAGPEMGETDDHAGVTAWRYAGADAEDLRETFLRMLSESNADLGLNAELDELTIGAFRLAWRP